MALFSLQEFADYLNIDKLLVHGGLAFFMAFGLTFFAIPKILRVSYKKRLMDNPIYRSSHNRRIPNLGGVGIFFGFLITASILAYPVFSEYIFFTAALILLFFVGLMDDLLIFAPRKKLIAQIVAAAFLVIGDNIRIHYFFGIFGFYEILYLISVGLSIFTFILIINSYNLIDGIDGLASMMAIIACGCYTYIFYKLENYYLIILSLSMAGSLLAFLRYNLDKKLKIFMGDTGSMLVGYFLAVLSIVFIKESFQIKAIDGELTRIIVYNSPIIAVAILFLPLLDTISVSIIRLFSGKPIFYADKNHIHHRFLNLGLTHLQTSIVLIIFNLIAILIAYLTRYSPINTALFILLFYSTFVSFIPYLVSKFILRKK